MIVLLVFTCFCSGFVLAAVDPMLGLGCVTEGTFTYCEGKSEVYNKLAGDAQGGGTGLDTRGQSDLLTREYGMRAPSQCDPNFRGRCSQVTANILPTYLVNSRDQPRYILQMGAFQQPVQLSICSGKVCGQYGFCEQNFINVQLLSWNPNDYAPALIIDYFRIPSCCKCNRGGSRPGGPWKWD